MLKSKKSLGLIIYVILLGIIVLSGCGEITLHHVSDAELETYLEKKYDCEFILQSKEVTPLTEEDKGDESNSCTLYTYVDKEGIVCHIYQTFCYNEAGTRFYDYTEDYQVMYVRCHPEILEELYASEFEVRCETESSDQKYASDNYWVKVDDSNEARDAATLIMDILSQMEPLPDTGYEISGKKINVERPLISLKNAGYNWYRDYSKYTFCFPTKYNPVEEDTHTVINEAVKPVQDYEKEQYMNYGAGWREYLANNRQIEDITYNGEVILDSLKYDDYYDCYVLTRMYYHLENGCNFYFTDFAEMLMAAGFEEEVSENCIQYTKGKRVVEFVKADELIQCTINGSPYEYEGRFLAAKESQDHQDFPLMELTEGDLYNLFGISFAIDEIWGGCEMQVEEFMD